MSLKLDIEEYPEEWSKEFIAAVEDYKNGKSKRKLRKFVNREISQYYYDELVKRYSTIHSINKEKRGRKIKDILCSVVALGIIFGSMANTLGDLVVRYGKGTALWYFILYFWAINYTSSSEEEERKISKLERENELLKDKIKLYEHKKTP